MNPPTSRPAVTWLSWLLLLLGACGFVAVWVLAGLYSNRQASWLAVLGALDVAWMLRLGHFRAGPIRAALAMATTAAVAASANWGIIAGEVGAELGLQPWESALRLGVHHAWTLMQLANGPGDLAWIALALLVAGAASR